MRTITPEEVEAAFKETGYQPISYAFLLTHNKEACALGVLGVVAGIAQTEIIKWINANFDSRYEIGLSVGFIGNKEKLSTDTVAIDNEGIIQQGFEDGWKVRKHLKGLGYKIKVAP